MLMIRLDAEGEEDCRRVEVWKNMKRSERFVTDTGKASRG